MIVICLGDVGRYLQEDASRVDSNARLITVDNFSPLDQGVYYTSIGDLGSLTNLSAVLWQANKIVYCPPAKWSDEVNGRSEMKAWTEDYLNVFKFRCQVENYSNQPRFQNITTLIDQRKTPSPQLWIAGCSISHGVGVSAETRYGHILSDQLGLEVSFLARPGSSLSWAADQILRSDIRSNDVVVWGLTSYARFSQFKNDKITCHNINCKNLTNFQLDYMLSDHLVYQSVTNIFQVVNFCKKMNVKLILAQLLDDSISNYLKDCPEFIMLCNLWGRNLQELYIDLGSDRLHPGELTHQFYADQIYQKYCDLYA